MFKLTPANAKLMKLAVQGVVALVGSALIGGIVKAERSASEHFDEYIKSKLPQDDAVDTKNI